MKKFLVMALVCALCMSGVAFADGMGVQIIGGDNLFTEQVSLDDVKLETPVEIDGWGTFTATEGKYVDVLFCYLEGKDTFDANAKNSRYDSGLDANYFILQVDITNTSFAAKDFLGDCEVKVVMNDDIEFNGWYYQYDWNNKSSSYYTSDDALKAINELHNKEAVIAANDQFEIEPWYTGHYCFGCTLPNAVVESDAPLAMIITIDGNEITYNIRK